MKHKALIALIAGAMVQAHAATAEKYWEKCPGPACPASTAPTDQEPATADKGRRPATVDKKKADVPVKEPMDKAGSKKPEAGAGKPAQEQRTKGY
ncbi:MAG: hypothetical protein HZA62_05510 [Rhodocyclales bacterium]|nr:hypothetical protein [Rhodocyclales bacterium]